MNKPLIKIITIRVVTRSLHALKPFISEQLHIQYACDQATEKKHMQYY